MVLAVTRHLCCPHIPFASRAKQAYLIAMFTEAGAAHPDAASPLERSAGVSPVSSPAVDALGRPLRDLRLSVTDRCNFRCTYCMPKEAFGRDHAFLPRSSVLSF